MDAKDVINILIDAECDFRECETAYSLGFDIVNCIKDKEYKEVAEKNGFLLNNKFLSISGCFNVARKQEDNAAWLMLESLSCGLGDVYLHLKSKGDL